MPDPEIIYKQRLESLAIDLKTLQKRKSLLGWGRFFSLVAAGIALWQLWTVNLGIAFLAFAVLFALFLFILNKDLTNNQGISNLQRLQAINQTEIEVLHHNFAGLADGSHFKPAVHAYANDLDIFGRASLYQYMDRANSEQGNSLFAAWLLAPAGPITIVSRQHAVRELTNELEWRQQLQSNGKSTPITASTEKKVISWLQEPFHFLQKPLWKILRIILPVISCSFLGLHLAGVLTASVFYPFLFVMLVVSLLISKRVMPAYIQLGKITRELESLSVSSACIEKKSFTDPLLSGLKKNFHPADGTASSSINRLKKILDMLDIRLNPLVFIPLNTFLFWDLQQVLVLEKWKMNNKETFVNWFSVLAEIECLCSLANFNFNHPQNAFPILSPDDGVYTADELGHPLIPKDKLVRNSFATEGVNQMNLITGSNMAGKSTFLRSVGVNLVLAMMGSSVLAKSMTVSPMKALSSMRVSDNLEESTSTFYAELKKLKEVIDAVYAGERVFLLLDEILRGTNSADRHTGSKALIRQLIHHRAAGLIATHDLELAKLADEYPGRIHNYHFDVQVADDELYFDYQLKRGICTSMNASLLMKKIGIEL